MDRQIDVAGAELPHGSPEARHARDSRWALLAAGAIGALIGAAAVLVMTMGDTRTETEIAATDTSLAAPAFVRPDPGAVRPPPSLAERVPGLTSDLVAFGFTPSGQAVIQQWFINATEPRTIDVPFGFAIVDASGQWIAALANQRYGDSLNLHVGNAAYQEAIATDVGSAVWSTDQPGRIVWTERTSAGVFAFEQDQGVGGDSALFEIPVPENARVVWLDGGRLTIASGGSIIALQQDGSEVARLDGAEFVAGADGWAAVRYQDTLTLVDADLVPRAPIPAGDEACNVRFARSSDGGTSPLLRLAALCSTSEGATLEVMDVAPTTLTFTSRTVIELAEPGAISWLDGDRFVAVPQPDPVSRPRSVIAILDTQTGTVTELQWPGAVQGVIGTR
ncbi:MAG: hypothetical protein OEQ47_03520 [Acidimicrobiia bacterium]|nr:hypothetical protein [Acidimicrobiia bacterium]